MKLFYLTIISFALLYEVGAYDSGHDDFPIEKVVADEKTLKEFVGCFTGKVGCNEVYAALNTNMHEAIKTDCAKCNDRQKEMFKIFLTALKNKLPAEYEEYKKKYDPENKHFDSFLNSVKVS